MHIFPSNKKYEELLIIELSRNKDDPPIPRKKNNENI
jgi:hypothetical protein